MNQEPIYVAIDVSKSRLDVGRSTQRRRMGMAYDEAWDQGTWHPAICSPWDQPQWCHKPLLALLSSIAT